MTAQSAPGQVGLTGVHDAVLQQTVMFNSGRQLVQWQISLLLQMA